MNNSTNTTAPRPYVRWHHVSWIIPEVTSILFVFVSLWVIYSLIDYGRKSKKWSHMHRRNPEKLTGGIIYSSLVVCCFSGLIPLLVSQAVMNVGFGKGKNAECEVVNDIYYVAFALHYLCFFVCLWLRQLIFYRNHMLNTPFTKALRIVSIGCIFLLFASGLGVTLVNVIPRYYPSSRSGCIYSPSSRSSSTIAWLSCSINLVVSQLILVGLFIYPFRQKLRCSNCNTRNSHNNPLGANTSSEPSSAMVNNGRSIQERKASNAPSSGKSTSKVENIMKRTLFFTAVAVVTDFAIPIITDNVLPYNHNRRFAILLYNANVLLNFMFVIGPFPHWKDMIISPLKTKKTADPQNGSATMISSV